MKKHQIVGMFLLLLLGACSKQQNEAGPRSEPPRIRVRAQRVQSKPHRATEEVVGTVRAKLHSVIEAKMAGRIEAVLVVPGQPVKVGEVLIQLDSREVQAKLDQAKAVKEQAEKSLERSRSMLAGRVASQAEFDAVEAQARVARASYVEAVTALGYMTIKAPFKGVITRKLADVGDLATPGKALLELDDPDLLRFEADVPEAISGSIESGAKLPVRIGALEVPGIVSEIAPVADIHSRTFLVKLDLPATKGLRAGQFGRVAIPVSETMVLRIPVKAVSRNGQMERVFVLDGTRARMRLVKTGKTFGDEVEILSGLESNEQILIGNAGDPDRLVDGQSVEVTSH